MLSRRRLRSYASQQCAGPVAVGQQCMGRLAVKDQPTRSTQNREIAPEAFLDTPHSFAMLTPP